MSIATLNLDDLKRHIGARQTASDVITAAPANLLRLTFDRREPELTDGDPLPAGWHVLYFLPRLTPGALRPDGAAAGSGVVPAMPLPRRMFAGQTFRFHRPLKIGQRVTQETELTDISAKSGGTGTLVFATTVSRITGPDGLAVEDERRTVFREEVKPGERNQAPRRDPAPSDVPWRRTITPDPVLLFRFSALTFNSHRIHYDHQWATQVEGYPALVVHGPLTSALLLDFARDNAGGRTITSYTTQARAPLFEGAPLELRGRPTDTGCDVWAVTPEGTIAMSARAELA